MKHTLLMLCCVVMTHHLVAQIYHNDRHNTNYNSAWISCNASSSPNPARGEGHWINYDLRRNYDIFQLSFWNLNDPSRLNEGVQNIIIDISQNGTDWTEAGTFTIPISNGSAFYKGINGPDLNGLTARYVLITAVDNYGGSCYGLSEVKIGVQESVLPVTLIDFSAYCDEEDVVLQWEVESEYNNESYTAQASTDGRIWKDIASIPGENKSGRYTYTLNHNSYNGGQEYYRVVQKDFDGSLNYFPVVSADCSEGMNALVISPNPVSSSAMISYASSASANGSATYEITDIRGRTLLNGVLSGSDEEVDFSSLAGGTYFMVITDGSLTLQQKLIKL
jgi:hypothetical protein